MFKSIVKIFIVVAIVVSVAGGIYFNNYVQHATGTNSTAQNITVPKGANLTTVSQQLQDAGVITSARPLVYYFWKEKLRGKLIAGNYVFSPGIKVPEIAFMLTTGDVQKDEVKITFPEGWTAKKVSERLAKHGFPADEFLKIVDVPSEELRADYSFLPSGKSLEGYLFPDTYIFARSTDADTIVRKMLTGFDLKVTDALRAEVKRQGKTLDEIITLASIVESEVPSVKDRKIVAGIFYNRIREDGWKLQSDATLAYALGSNKIKHTFEDLEFDSPYNTYKYPGLPPGPVASPSITSIEATIYPDVTEFFFFLNNPKTGETFFARTLAEHAVNRNNNGLASDEQYGEDITEE